MLSETNVNLFIAGLSIVTAITYSLVTIKRKQFLLWQVSVLFLGLGSIFIYLQVFDSNFRVLGDLIYLLGQFFIVFASLNDYNIILEKNKTNKEITGYFIGIIIVSSLISVPVLSISVILYIIVIISLLLLISIVFNAQIALIVQTPSRLFLLLALISALITGIMIVFDIFEVVGAWDFSFIMNIAFVIFFLSAGLQLFVDDRLEKSEINYRKAYEALKISERKSRAILDTLPDYLFVLDIDGCIVAYEGTRTSQIGEVRKNIGRDISELLPREIVELILPIIQQTINTGVLQHLNYQFPTNEGERFFEARFVKYSKNTVLTISRDITDLKIAEDALETSEIKYQSLVNNLPVVTWISDSEGNTSFISKNIEKVYGYTPSEIYQKGEELWFNRIHPKDIQRVKEEYTNLFLKNTQFDIEYRIKHKNGKWIWIQDRGIMVYEEGGKKHADGILFDISDRKKAESIRKQLEQRHDDFIAMVSHELRTPLQALRGSVDYLQLSTNDNLSMEKIAKLYPILLKNVVRLERLSNDVERAFQIADGTFAIVRSKILFCDLISEIFQPYIDSLGDSFIINECNDHMVTLLADKAQLSQAINNIMENAIKYTHKGTRKIIVNIKNDENTVGITINDNGIGIPLKNQKELFRRFVSFPTEISVTGTGIGLYLAREIISIHNGSIRVESAGKDQGTSIIITLPI